MSLLDAQIALGVAIILFFIGLWGLLVRKHLIVILMCLEVMLGSAYLGTVTFSKLNDEFQGGAVLLFFLAIAATEIALGLGISLLFYKRYGTLDISQTEESNG